MDEQAHRSSGTPARRVLSGVQPSHRSLHLGNYLGALRQWVDVQDQAETFFCIVDLHAMTSAAPGTAVGERSRTALAQLLAAGVDPDVSTVFRQSQVPEHTTFGWLLGCLARVDDLQRLRHFQDKSRREATLGLLAFPVQQAADILLYRADTIPVGPDLLENIAYARLLAERFNTRYGPVVVAPTPLVSDDTALVRDLQHPTVKMSKSARNHDGVVSLLDDPDCSAGKVAAAVLDDEPAVTFDPSGRPGVANLLQVHAGLTGTTPHDVCAAYTCRSTSDLRRDTASLVRSFVAAYSRRTRAFLRNEPLLDQILHHGAARARPVAADTLHAAYHAVGLLP